MLGIAAASGLTAFSIAASSASALSGTHSARTKSAKPVKTASAPAPDWMADAVIYEANLRQGTKERNLRGMQKELPRLKDLGVDIIWLMPVHPISESDRKGSLGSYYAVKDYKAVNPEFGTIDDLKEFVRTAHHLGLKVIIDEVCNHTGTDHIWVKEHPEYYAYDKEGRHISPYDWTDTYKLDYSNPGLRRAMTDALLFWVKEADIDGYRCDVAGEVPTDFWEEATAELRKVKPVFMLAEASKPELLEKAFNADYAWPMKDLFNAIAFTHGENAYDREHGKKHEPSRAIDIFRLLDRLDKEYPAGAVHMNMITNHDLNSWEGTEFDRYGNATGAFAILSYTLPGMPMMYTGQETGFNHPFEFFELDSVQPDYTANAFTSFYEMLNALKAGHPALNAGNPEGEMTRYIAVSPDVIAFTRKAGHDAVTVIANLSADDIQLTFPDLSPDLDSMTDYFSGAPAEMPGQLKAWQTLVFVRE